MTTRKPADSPYLDPDNDFSGHLVLLAEDSDLNREIMLELLRPTGMVIYCVDDGANAVRRFMYFPDLYDMIFMAIHLPEMDGYEATQAIRSCRLPRSTTIPIVAMTADVTKRAIAKYREAGMDDHIGRPPNYTQLTSQLRRYIPT